MAVPPERTPSIPRLLITAPLAMPPDDTTSAPLELGALKLVLVTLSLSARPPDETTSAAAPVRLVPESMPPDDTVSTALMPPALFGPIRLAEMFVPPPEMT